MSKAIVHSKLDYRMRQGRYAILVIILLYAVSHCAMAYQLIVKGKYVGEARSVLELTVASEHIVLLLFITLFTYYILYYLYYYTKIKKSSICGYYAVINKRKMHWYFFVMVVIQIAFFLTTNVGASVGSKTSRFSWIFALINVRALFFVYYVGAREKKALYIINIFLFSALRLLQGWMSFIIDIFIMEMLLTMPVVFKRMKINEKSKRIPVAALYTSVAGVLSGSKMYQYFYGIRHKIRGYSSGIHFLSFGTALLALVSRLSFFPQSVAAIQMSERIKELYAGKPLREFVSIFRPLVPGFLMAEKNFMNLHAIIKQSMVDYPVSGSSTNVGIVSYAFLLFKSDATGFIIWLMLTILLTVLFRKIFSILDDGTDAFNALYFYMLLQIVQVSAIEPVFSYQFLPFLYHLPMIFVFGIFSFKKEKLQ